MKNISSLGGLEPPTFRLTAERANRLRHRDESLTVMAVIIFIQYNLIQSHLTIKNCTIFFSK